jgi:hypothetical protein
VSYYKASPQPKSPRRPFPVQVSFSSIAIIISLFSISTITETNHGANCRTIESASPWKKNSQENQKIFKECRVSTFFNPTTAGSLNPHRGLISSLETLLQTRHFLDREFRDECLKRRTWTVARFCQELRLAVPNIAVIRPNSSASFNELIAKLPVHFDLEDPTFELTLDDKLQGICANFPDVTKQMEYTAAKLLISRLPEQSVNWQAILFREFGTRKVIIETVSDFRFVWKAIKHKISVILVEQATWQLVR